MVIAFDIIKRYITIFLSLIKSLRKYTFCYLKISYEILNEATK